MFEYPEIKTLARQMKNEIIGKTVQSIEEVENIYSNENYSPCNNGTVKEIECVAPGLYIMLDNGYGIMMKDAGGKLLYNKTSSGIPKNYGVIIKFTDGSNITYSAGLGACWLSSVSHEDWQKQKADNKMFDPLAGNTFEDYIEFINSLPKYIINNNYILKNPIEEIKKPIKTFLSTNVFGVKSTFAAEILLYAKVYPSTQLRKLNEEQHKRIYNSMKFVLTSACEKGGRVNEFNLYGQKGNYIAMAERKHIGEDCPVCGTTLGKVSVGGVTAFCPNCQVK